MKQIIIYILLTINSFGLNLQYITKVPIPSNITTTAVEDLRFGAVRNDGTFLVQTGNDRNSGVVGWLIKPDGNYITFLPFSLNEIRTTNIVSISQVNGQVVTILDEISVNTYKFNNGKLILKTASPKGCLFNEDVQVNTYKTTFKMIANKVESYYENYHITKFTVVSKYDFKGNLIESINVSGLNTLYNTGPGPFLTESQELNKVFTAEIKDGFVYFYRLTDSDLLSSPNRITLGSSQNGSLTATVNNPEQALLSIQSSTNLIDWNTFKTIKNEHSLEIVVPANKPQELIRAIE